MLSNVTLYHGDCLEYMKSMPDKSVDLVLTDPPYNFESQGGGFHSNKLLVCGRKPRKYIDKLKATNSTEFEPKLFLCESKRLMNKFNFVACCNKSLIDVYIGFARENNYTFDIHVIYKSNPIPARNNHFLHNLEYVVVIRESGANWNKYLSTEIYNKAYFTICEQSNFHPAEKDVELFGKYIEILSCKDYIIFDPFMGSGTTGIACVQLERNFIGCEISKDYFDIAKNRIEEAQNTLFTMGEQPKEKESDLQTSLLPELVGD